MAKEFLSSKGVEFEVVDVTEDPQAMDEMLKISGAMATPVIVIGDEVIVGWDRGKVERALKL
ncbi:glutaredoxin family protein [Effusibacillus lacus]|uniref:NrdH-redoxin n=1 Tax=Effusibacillus lacus TaxID=1348429 RepID=A0A292YT42_9BACL|nr:glutaredoxin family protein [Effusibacillus lacus]TCS74981.1 glutaredoxin [Effusibacillus lacus]GAX91650.1 NrdH-redoxin [Effusibacillus lacus]